jgi:hypothetical protein
MIDHIYYVLGLMVTATIAFMAWGILSFLGFYLVYTLF